MPMHVLILDSYARACSKSFSVAFRSWRKEKRNSGVLYFSQGAIALLT